MVGYLMKHLITDQEEINHDELKTLARDKLKTLASKTQMMSCLVDIRS